ncbi:hypothetical protein [Planobispora rosea]|nr:hypothetical protein [Planobispora rosea]
MNPISETIVGEHIINDRRLLVELATWPDGGRSYHLIDAETKVTLTALSAYDSYPSEQQMTEEVEKYNDHARELTRQERRERQLKIDAMRALAELAAEIEELTARDVSFDTLISRVRGLATCHRLTAIGSAGADAGFDPKRHQMICGNAEPGTAVVIHRPGYTWRHADEEIVLSKALVGAKQPAAS